jgi:hypothetical protein
MVDITLSYSVKTVSEYNVQAVICLSQGIKKAIYQSI